VKGGLEGISKTWLQECVVQQDMQRYAIHSATPLTTPPLIDAPPTPTPTPKVNIVGDFDSSELEGLCLAYLGTVAPQEGAGTPADGCVVEGWGWVVLWFGGWGWGGPGVGGGWGWEWGWGLGSQ